MRQASFRILFLSFMLCAMSGLASCEDDRDDGLFRLRVEASGGAKVVVQDEVSRWVEGDQVRVNGVTAQVEYVGGEPCVRASSASVNRAVYPASLTGDPLTGDAVGASFPSAYRYRYDSVAGGQLLETPMAARSEASGELLFYHLGGVVCVTVANTDASQTLTIDEASLESNKYQLCGARDIALDDLMGIAPAEAGAAADRRVAMLFGGGLALAPGQEVSVMIPVLPVGADNRFTIRVESHVEGTRYTYRREQSTGHALSRNQIAYAHVDLSAATTEHVTAQNLFDMDGGTLLISTPNDFANMVQAINGDWQYEGTYYKNCKYRIENDLDLSGYTVAPINGEKIDTIMPINFDGHTLRNLTIESATFDNNTYHCGLFCGMVRGNLVGLTLENLTLRHHGTMSGKNLFMGALCSSTDRSVTVAGCTVDISAVEITGELPRHLYFGSLFGRSMGGNLGTGVTATTITCNEAQVSVSASLMATGTIYAGGLVGFKSNGTVSAQNANISGEINAQTESSVYNCGKYIGYAATGAALNRSNATATLVFRLGGVEQASVPDYSSPAL